MKDYKTYYVTYVYYNNGSYHHNSREYPLYIEDNLKPGVIAQMLENKLSEFYDDQTITIINFWEM